MSQSNNILQELQELNSSLVKLGNDNCYQVPAGYFDGLAERMLLTIKAMNASDTVEELNLLSPAFNVISKEVPYKVPAGYFDGLAERVMQTIRENNEYETADEEIESLSPLLSSLKKQNPYTVPQGYFETIQPVKKETKVISFTKQNWFRYAVAAVVIGIITLTGILLFGKKGEERRLAKFERFEKRLDKEISKSSDDALKDFIQYTDAGLTGEEKVSTTTNTEEIKELLKDIPESELKEFIEETAVTETETTMMN